MSRLDYLFFKALKRLRGRAIRSSTIHPSSTIEPGSEVAHSTLDRHSFCGYNCHLYYADIGSYCSIGDNCRLGMGSHPYDWIGTSPAFYHGRDSIKLKLSHHQRAPVERVSIGHDVWIGAQCLVRSGVKIGTGAVVGMGSVVTRDVEPYMIVAGSPARPIRRRFEDDLVHRLLRSEWWTLDEQTLKSAAVYAQQPEKFLEALGK
jgi:acetyltransferase-like isoleucine patch superfamily enzyme